MQGGIYAEDDGAEALQEKAYRSSPTVGIVNKSNVNG